MSLATRTDSILFSSLNFGSKKRADDRKATTPRKAARESAQFLAASRAIYGIARRVVGQIIQNRRDMQRSRQLLSSSDESYISAGQTKISFILWNMPQRADVIVDLAASGRLANRAMWSLFCLSAIPRAAEADTDADEADTEADESDTGAAEADEAIAYVMRELIIPHKLPTPFDEHSLLYKTMQRPTVIGPKVFAAIVSCKDHCFREWELADTVTIQAFQNRYNVKVKNGYVFR